MLGGRPINPRIILSDSADCQFGLAAVSLHRYKDGILWRSSFPNVADMRTAPANESAKSQRTHALAALRRLELAVQKLSRAEEIKPLLRRVGRMIGEP